MERLAAKAGLSKGMVSLVERELRNPTLDTVLRIARALNIEAGSLINRIGTEAEIQRKK
jgi:transcriptional regulator with XRE-family HTH domain